MSLTVHRHWDDPLVQRNLENPSVPITEASLLAMLHGPAADSGVTVSPDSALRIAAVYRCVAILGGSLGQLPLHVYERTERGKRRATDRPEFRLLHRAPNDEMSAFVWKETGQGHLCLRGNAYSRLEWARNNTLRAVWPLDPDTVVVERVAGRLRYTVRLRDDSRRTEALAPDEVLHIPALSTNGIVGFNPIEVLRQPVGIAAAAESTAAKLFRDGIRGSGILALKQDGLTKDQFDAARAELESVMAGRLHRALVIGGDAEWKPLTITPDDAQFLETRKFQVTEIASRIFGLPPHMVGDVEKSTSWGTGIEQQGIGFVVYSLGPWLSRWEQELDRKLFPGDLGDRYFCKFNLAGLLRGDVKARYEAYQIAIQNGWLSPNDVLELEDMNTFEGGDVHLQPLNFAPWGTAPAPADPAPQDPAGGDDDAA